jgi:hypothetical protein
MGRVYSFSSQALCDFALDIRPIVLGTAYLSAALIFFGFARRGN